MIYSNPTARATGMPHEPAREKEVTTMSDEKLIEVIAQAAAQAAVAAVQTLLGTEAQNAMEAAVTEAARVGAQVGAEASVKAVERERKKFRDARSDRRFRNTKYLLRNYNMLAKHCSNAVYDRASDVTHSEGIEDILEMLDEMLDEGIQVESIMKSAARTQIIMDHVNRMLGIYRTYCTESQKPEEQRHYRVIEALYLTPRPKTAEAVAAQEKIDKRTVYKDIDAACATLSALIFGIDGIKKAG